MQIQVKSIDKFLQIWYNGLLTPLKGSMITKQQELHIVALYKAGHSYKDITYETNVPSSTAASLIRRKYPEVQRASQFKRGQLAKQRIKKIQTFLNCSHTHAMAIYSAMEERFNNKRRSCLQSGKQFTISFDDLTFPDTCPYLGIKLDYFETSCKADCYPTFDRIDNNKGYIPGNVLIVSWRGNRIKNDSTAEELLLLATNLQRLQECKNTDNHCT